MILSEKDSKNTISLKEFWDQQSEILSCCFSVRNIETIFFTKSFSSEMHGSPKVNKFNFITHISKQKEVSKPRADETAADSHKIVTFLF